MTTPASPAQPHHDGKWRAIALISLPVLGILLVIIAIYLVRPRDSGVVTVVVSGDQAGAAAINTGEIIDATLPGAILEPRLGYRYKVFVEDESDDRSSGIAKIGGRATFIPGARRGQTAIVDTTRVRDRVVDAVLVRVLSEVALPPKPPRTPFVPAADDPAAHVVPGAEMDVIIAEASSKNPATEGVAKVGGLVVFVQGATAIGERVNIRITDRRERVAFAELTGQPAGTGPLASAGTTGDVLRRAFSPRANDPAAHVIAGAEMDVVITEASKMNPATEGVAKVNGLVVFVQGATTIGERVNVRITARRERMAFAELSGKPAGTEPLPAASAPAPRRAFEPGPGDSAAFVVPGAVVATTIVEPSEKNPATEGVAKIGGLVVFVQGATTIGQPVNVRITDRRRTVAMGEVTTDAPTAGPGAESVAAPVAAPAEAPAAPAPEAAPVASPAPAEAPAAP